MTAVRSGGKGPRLVPLHRWGLKFRLDGEITGLERLDELGVPRWVEPGVPLESNMQVLQPTLDDPYFTFVVEATSERSACDTVVQALAQLQGDDHAE